MRKNIYIKFLNLALILASALLIGFEAHLLTRAQEGSAATDIANQGDVCADGLQKYLDEEKIQFSEFINNHFRSDENTSELIPTAIEKFREYRNNARTEMAKFLPRAGAKITASAGERAACEQVLADDFGVVKELLKQHISANASAKKATRLINRYKQINAKLNDLNFTIAQMYGYFAAFSDKLPCYAASCITN